MEKEAITDSRDVLDKASLLISGVVAAVELYDKLPARIEQVALILCQALQSMTEVGLIEKQCDIQAVLYIVQSYILRDIIQQNTPQDLQNMRDQGDARLAQLLKENGVAM